METIYEQWKKVLDDFQNNVVKELNEIRRCKAEMQQIKSDFIDQFSKGQYFRDDQRIIISAPEIIIGDVSKDGTLNTTGTSTVIIRSNKICQEGVGDLRGNGGSITNKASEIKNICIDPGIDGIEEVVSNQSQYIVQAQGITLQSEETKGVFTEVPSTSIGEINLKADKHIHLDAIAPLKGRKKNIEDITNAKKTSKSDLEKKSNDKLKDIETKMTEITKLLEDGQKLFAGDETIRSTYKTADELHNKIKDESNILCTAINDYQEATSNLAETNRQIKCLEAKKTDIDKKEGEKDKGTGTSVDIQAESTRIKSINADNEICCTPGAGLDIRAKDIKIQSTDEKGAVVDESSLDILTHSINLSTINPKHEENTSDIPAEGDVHITSKNIVMESVDREFKDDKLSEKALTKDGCIKMRAETVDVSTNDTEGKATGKFNVNSKNIVLKSMDIDKEKRTDTELTKDSTMVLVSDKIYAGSPDKEKLSQSIQISSDKVAIFAKTTAEMKQDEKATLQLDGGNTAISGSKTNVFGETTVNGKTTFKAETIFGKATIDNAEITKSFKSPTTSEGTATPSSSSTDKIATKLQLEDVPKDESESK